mmetsp:Transcript_31253/g.34998  ORF Transcript_31253/g.34998 Transcript_31253/m.34998 type:complete len:104 (-) Transcript_31253:402-713(-)
MRLKFIIHPNGIVLRVFKQTRKYATTDTPLLRLKFVVVVVSDRCVKQRLQRVKQKTETCRSPTLFTCTPLAPQQQYKSKSWTIAIILKLTFVAWDSWTYRIGY